MCDGDVLVGLDIPLRSIIKTLLFLQLLKHKRYLQAKQVIINRNTIV